MENKITHLFEENKVTISGFAKRNKIPYGTLYDIATGRTPIERIRFEIVVKIARGLGMTVDDFLGAEEIDPRRYELCVIFDDLSPLGRRALMASAQALAEVFQEEAEEMEVADRYDDEMADSWRG